MHRPEPNGNSAGSSNRSGDTVDPPDETGAVPTEGARRESRTDTQTTKAVLGRRSYLSLVGLGVIAPVAGSRPVQAETTRGYGIGEYGVGEYGVGERIEEPDETEDTDDTDDDSDTDDDDDSEESSLSVETVSADEITSTSVVLGGFISSVDADDSTKVSFEYRKADTDEWQQTDSTSPSDGGTFRQQLSELSPSTTYEYRAVAERDDDAAVGETKTFNTLTNETSSPVIDQLSVKDVSPPNPHAELVVDWEVSDPDGDLEKATLVISDYKKTHRWEQISLEGATASGTEEVSVRHGTNTTYVVTLLVVDAAGNQTIEKEQLELY